MIEQQLPQQTKNTTACYSVRCNFFYHYLFYGSKHMLAWAVRARLPEWTPAAGRIGDRRSPRPASAYARMTIELLWSISAWGKGLRGARQGNIIASACPLYGMSPNLLIPVEHVTWWKGFLLGAIKKPDKPWKPLRSSSLFAVVDRFRVYYVGIIGKLALALNSMSSLGQISAMRQN